MVTTPKGLAKEILLWPVSQLQWREHPGSQVYFPGQMDLCMHKNPAGKQPKVRDRDIRWGHPASRWPILEQCVCGRHTVGPAISATGG